MRPAVLLGLVLAIWSAALQNRPPEVTFAEIAGIMRTKCAPCHQPGGAAPFSLLSYADAKKRARLIGIAAITGAMPPCFASSDFGTFYKTGVLSTDQAVLIRKWALGGAPEGKSVSQEVATPLWSFGRPHKLINVGGDSVIRADGGTYHLAIGSNLQLSESASLVAFDVRPGSPRAVRQIALSLGDREIGTWAPNHYAWRAPIGYGVTLRPGDKLAFKVRAHPTGKTESAGLLVALYFGKSNARNVTTKISGLKWVPTDSVSNEKVATEFKLDHSVLVSGIAIRLAPDARRARISVINGGQVKRLLDVLWVKDWIGAYNFIHPPLLRKGTLVRVEVELADGARLGSAVGDGLSMQFATVGD